MWLFVVEAYLFVLVAFSLGVGIGLVGVRLCVRRLAPPPAPRSRQPRTPRSSTRSRRGGKDADASAEAGTTKGGAA
jgi:hypothetical protein